MDAQPRTPFVTPRTMPSSPPCSSGSSPSQPHPRRPQTRSTWTTEAGCSRRNSLSALPPPPPAAFPLAAGGRALALFFLAFAVTIVAVAAQSASREFRSFDGSGNNLQNPRWGTVDQPYIRSQVAQTANFSAASVANLRVLSNGLARSERDIKNVRQLTVLHTFWGEFLIHDIAHVTSSRAPADRATVNVPDNDRFLPPGSNFSFFRAIAVGQGAQRIPVNVATSYIDGSHLYGATPEQANSLRDGALMRLVSNSEGSYPPTVAENRNGANTSTSTLPPGQDQLFAFGSIVGNTSPYSQALYTLFLREHNRYVGDLRRRQPGISDEEAYQQARTHVIALLQHITYYEYIPLLLGQPIDPYLRYDPRIRPDVDAFFASVAYRFGHSEIPTFLSYIDRNTNRTVQVDLASNFFRTDLIMNLGLSPFFAGMATQVQDEMDLFYAEPMRSTVFGPRLGGMDGFCFDLFRAKDYQIPSYTAARRAFGLSVPATFNDINPEFGPRLAAVYRDVNDVDALVGGLIEPREMRETNLGPMFTRSVVTQFKALRDGDRFWFENPGVLTPQHLEQIRNTSLRDVIMRNTLLSRLPISIPENVWQVVPDAGRVRIADAPPGFPFSMELAPGYRLSWVFENQGSADETMRFMVQCQFAGYCAFGLGGGSMLSATEMYIARRLGSDISVSEYRPTGAYSRPVVASQAGRTGPPPISIVSSRSTQGDGFQIEFRRKTMPPGGRVAIRKDGQQPMIWSYSIVGSREITFHGSNRGTVSINFFTGASAQQVAAIELTGVLLAHAIMMFTAFGFLMPLAVAIARYLRTCEGWVMGHVGLQVLASLMAIIAGALSISVTQLGNSAHGVVGLCLYSLILLQLLIGFTNLRRLLFGSRSKWLKYIKLVHNNLGRFILAVAVFNIPLAINLVHPTTQSGSLGMPWWIVYFVVGSLWLMFFGVMETKRILLAAKLKGASTGSLPRANVMGTTKANTKQVAAEQIVIERDDLPLVSWRDVDEEVVKGKRWVVGNGFVYDIETWVFNHPGGQSVLYGVLGTDISSDFFNNSGYDMDLFTPWADRPDFDEAPPTSLLRQRRSSGPSIIMGGSDESGAIGLGIVRKSPNQLTDGTHDGSDLRSRASGAWNNRASIIGVDQQAQESPMNRLSVVSAAPSDASGIFNRDVEADPRILKEDWKLIMRARNQHFHSPEAIGKLKKLVVAKLDVACQNQFNKDEYRRYALTSKELLSSAGADAEVYRLKFCLLFPNELYEEDPLFLFPGQAIELQLRVRGQFVSRYYTPCSGNMAVFDMIAKCLPDGVMSNVFRQTRPGELQFKIRGPFGSPLINIERPLPMHNGCWDEVLCIGVGSGMTPHLQMLSWYFMQTTFSLRPAADNIPTKASELAVKRSHKVFIRHPLQNGWVFATNADTAQDGIIHLSKLTPWIGRQARVTVVNAARNIASLIGTDMLEAVCAAYPDQLALEYVLTREAPSPATANGGQVRYHTCRVDRQFLATLLERKKWIQQGNMGRSQRVVLCGPEKFMQQTYTTLVELGVPEDDVISLPAHSYLVNPHWSWTPIKYTGSQSGNKGSQLSPATPSTTGSRPARFDSLPPTGGSYPSSDANSTNSSFSSMSSSRTAVPPNGGGGAYDAGSSFFNGSGDGNGGDGELMSATEYAAALPPSLPVRVDPRNNEPQWFYLPQETMPIHPSMECRQSK